MPQSFFAIVTVLDGAPGQPAHPIHIPGYPDQGLPGQGGQPSHPIAGQPGQPSHPIAGQPGQPTHPIHIPGVPDQGLPPGEAVPPDAVQLPELPSEYADDLIIAVHKPGDAEWTVTAYPVGPDQGLPPHPDQGLPPQPPAPSHPIARPPAPGQPARPTQPIARPGPAPAPQRR